MSKKRPLDPEGAKGIPHDAETPQPPVPDVSAPDPVVDPALPNPEPPQVPAPDVPLPAEPPHAPPDPASPPVEPLPPLTPDAPLSEREKQLVNIVTRQVLSQIDPLLIKLQQISNEAQNTSSSTSR